MFKRIIKDQRGAIFAEYSLLAALIAIACLISVSVLGASVLILFQSGGLLEAL
jgi:Flp pilus assembly pilin Flp